MVSRVTERTLLADFLNSVGRLRRQQVAAQNALSSQKRLREASDDPVGAARSTSLRGEAKELDAYRNSVALATTTLGAADGVLGQAHDILIRAREIAAGMSSGLVTPQARQTAAEEVEELERGLLALGNTTIAGRYVFGGLATSGPPFASLDDPGFSPATAYTGPVAPFAVRMARDETMRVTTSGDGVFGSSLAALDDLRQTLAAGNDPSASLSALGGAAEDIRQERASVGGRLARLQARNTEIATAVIATKTSLGGVEDADLTATITELAQVQNALEATLTAGSSLLQTSILDFLRL
ncbi:MAG: flagellar hook-associated protein 3 [Polyangiaceae bacterium UTPRO1]|jgi:flagellar hook-associated protein 3 FlgL|nr:MAG: flagellar hook-associated protein 3 [Polyangiaceae bacterium UTPRO1]